MRDAVGGSLLLNLVVIFVSLVILFFVSILSYSKAYRIKNHIIEVIEKYEKYDEDTALAMQSYLQDSGYMTANYTKLKNECGDSSLTVTTSFTPGYLYCVYNKPVSQGKMYEVVTYINFNFPIIGDLLTFRVRGETKILGKEYNY